MLLRVRVKPNSKKPEIELKKDFRGFYLSLHVKKPPKKGMANKEVDKVLRKVFGDYSFVSGATSRDKFIKVAGDIDNISEMIRTYRKD